MYSSGDYVEDWELFGGQLLATSWPDAAHQPDVLEADSGQCGLDNVPSPLWTNHHHHIEQDEDDWLDDADVNLYEPLFTCGVKQQPLQPTQFPDTTHHYITDTTQPKPYYSSDPTQIKDVYVTDFTQSDFSLIVDSSEAELNYLLDNALSNSADAADDGCVEDSLAPAVECLHDYNTVVRLLMQITDEGSLHDNILIHISPDDVDDLLSSASSTPPHVSDLTEVMEDVSSPCDMSETMQENEVYTSYMQDGSPISSDGFDGYASVNTTTGYDDGETSYMSVSLKSEDVSLSYTSDNSLVSDVVSKSAMPESPASADFTRAFQNSGKLPTISCDAAQNVQLKCGSVSHSSRSDVFVAPCVERRVRKKEQNKTAAQRYRRKKRSEQTSTLTEQEMLEQRNEQLKSEANELQREIDYLKTLVATIYNAKAAK